MGAEFVWILYVVMVLVFLWFGFSRGYVAMKAGVYPASKFFFHRTLYAYSPEKADTFRKLGRVQIYLAIGCTIIALAMIFFYLLF